MRSFRHLLLTDGPVTDEALDERGDGQPRARQAPAGPDSATPTSSPRASTASQPRRHRYWPGWQVDNLHRRASRVRAGGYPQLRRGGVHRVVQSLLERNAGVEVDFDGPGANDVDVSPLLRTPVCSSVLVKSMSGPRRPRPKVSWKWRITSLRQLRAASSTPPPTWPGPVGQLAQR